MKDANEQPEPAPRSPKRRSRRWLLGTAAAGAGAAAAGLWVRGCDLAVPDDMDLTDLAPAPGGKRDLTFFVAADTHFGVEGMAARNRKQIEVMNALPGTPYPPALGGQVGDPVGVLIAGDLTQDATAAQWRPFVEHYGLTGRDGLLKYPVQECAGNHDREWGKRTVVEAGIKKRHGSLVRGWVWQGVCFFCLDCYPDRTACLWLGRQLDRAGPNRPCVIYFHYSILGSLSDYWSDAEKRTFVETIDGSNVLGIFHGHDHASRHYTWQGFDVYNVGSPRGGADAHTFAVVRITDSQMTVASRPWDAPPPGSWSWTHSKAVPTTQA